MPARKRQEINIAVVGIIYLNGIAGRSHEWQVMKASHVREQITKGRDFVTCTEYRTAKGDGELGKWLAPGTIEALRRVMELPSRGTDLLLEPPRGAPGCVRVNTYLEAFGAVYLPGYPAPGVKLLEMFYHSESRKLSNRDKILDASSRVDAPSAQVALDACTLRKPSDDAQLGKALFTLLMGEPVAFPPLGAAAAQGATATTIAQLAPPADVDGQESRDRPDNGFVQLPAAAPLEDAEELAEDGAAPAAALGAGAAPPCKRRRTLLSSEQKAWILEEHRRATGVGQADNTRAWSRRCLESGIRAGIFTRDNTIEGIRNIIRRR